MERIRAQQPRFEVDATNAAAVADICRRLDGIPLALELVAARAGALTLDELRDRLDERFRLLTRGARSALPRQQTLRALIDWSYDLLSAAEQRTLARCAVFAGSFDLDGAEVKGLAGTFDGVFDTGERISGRFEVSRCDGARLIVGICS